MLSAATAGARAFLTPAGSWKPSAFMDTAAHEWHTNTHTVLALHTCRTNRKDASSGRQLRALRASAAPRARWGPSKVRKKASTAQARRCHVLPVVMCQYFCCWHQRRRQCPGAHRAYGKTSTPGLEARAYLRRPSSCARASAAAGLTGLGGAELHAAAHGGCREGGGRRGEREREEGPGLHSSLDNAIPRD